MMNITDQVRLSYPLPIARSYEAMSLEEEPRQRVQKLVELFEGVTRYLVLVGLSGYIHYELSSKQVEEARPELAKPSLGSWVRLLRAIDQTLRTNDKPGLIENLKRNRRNSPIYDASQALGKVTGIASPKRIRLVHFFDSVIQFRNKKIGHGSLPLREAKFVLKAFEAALSQWLAELSILYQQHLVYVERVEWQNPHFTCYGTNLNSGTTLSPWETVREEPVTPDQVYLHQHKNDSLVPLHPFFLFDNDTHLLYIYDELSGKGELILRCPYEAPGAKPARRLHCDDTIVVGNASVSDTPEPSMSDEPLQRAPVSKYLQTLNLIKKNLTEAWLTDSQKQVWMQLSKFMEPPYYVVNIYGAEGTGKTFLGWLLQKQSQARYADASDLDWQSWKGTTRIVLDGHDPSRRAVRSLREQLHIWEIEQAIILTRQKAQDDIPCLHIKVTDKDIGIVKANLYRELEIVLPEGDYRNLADCFKHLEE